MNMVLASFYVQRRRYAQNHQPLKVWKHACHGVCLFPNPPTIEIDLFPQHVDLIWPPHIVHRTSGISATCIELVPGWEKVDAQAHVWCRGFSTTACVAIVPTLALRSGPTSCANDTRRFWYVNLGFRGCFLLGRRQTLYQFPFLERTGVANKPS